MNRHRINRQRRYEGDSYSSSITGARSARKITQLFESYPDLLSVNDLSNLTGVSNQTIRALINSGELPGCRIGRRLYVSKAQFIAFVEGGIK